MRQIFNALSALKVLTALMGQAPGTLGELMTS